MFGNAFGWPHLIVILLIVLLLFGAPKLPGLARSIGQSMRIFRSEVKTPPADAVDEDTDQPEDAADEAATKPAARKTAATTKKPSAKSS